MKKARFLSVFMISAMLLGGCGQAGPQTQEPSQTPETEAAESTETQAADTEPTEDAESTETEAASADSSEGVTLTVGTFNIDAKSQPDIAAQSKLMADHKVEILGIQEVDHNTIRNNYNMAEKFASDPYTDYFYTNAIGFQGGEYGIATISSFEIKESAAMELYSAEFKGKELAEELKEAYLNHNPDDQATVDALDAVSEKGPIEPRCFQRVLIEKEGKEIAFYNTHLSWEDKSLRAQQMETLVKALDEDACEYKIIVGDFNADQETAEFDIFTENYSIANGKDGQWLDTFNGADDTMKVFSVDNVIVSKNITIDSVNMIENTLSDHNPMVVELTLQ